MSFTEWLGALGLGLGACSLILLGLLGVLAAHSLRRDRKAVERSNALKAAAESLLLARDLANRTAAANDALEQIPVMTYDPHPWA